VLLLAIERVEAVLVLDVEFTSILIVKRSVYNMVIFGHILNEEQRRLVGFDLELLRLHVLPLCELELSERGVPVRIAILILLIPPLTNPLKAALIAPSFELIFLEISKCFRTKINCCLSLLEIEFFVLIEAAVPQEDVMAELVVLVNIVILVEGLILGVNVNKSLCVLP